MILGEKHAVRTRSAVCSVGEGARPHFVHGRMESPNTGPQALSLTQAARGKPIPTGLAPVPGHKNTEPECIFTVLRFPFLICPFKSADAKSSKIVQKIPRSWRKSGS